jgi:hypothetical protein
MKNGIASSAKLSRRDHRGRGCRIERHEQRGHRCGADGERDRHAGEEQ